MSAATIAQGPVVKAARKGHYKFSGLMRSEWTKLRTVRSTMWTLGPATHATFGSPDALRAVAGSGLYLCVMGLLALGLAAIIRHTAGAISAFAGILLPVPLVVQQLPSSLDNDLARYTPLRIGVTVISGPPQPNTFSPWTGLAVLCVYAAVLLVIGGVILVKRDA